MKDPSRHRQQGTAFYLTLLAAAGMLTCVLLAGPCRGQCEGGRCFTAPSGQYDVLAGRSVANPNWQPQAIRTVQASADPNTMPDFTAQLDGSPDKAVCMVATFNEQLGKWAVGSGTMIAAEGNEALVMTCVHGASLDENRNFCIFGEGTHPRATYPARILEYDAKADVMVLIIRRPPGIEPIALSDLDTQAGDRVWTAGYAASSKGAFTADSGKVIPPEPNAQWTDGTIATNAKASPGQSGGPIFNEYRRVCGVISGGDQFGRTYGTSTTHIRKAFPRLRSWLTGLRPGPTIVQRTRTPQGNMVIRRPMAPMPRPQAQVPPPVFGTGVVAETVSPSQLAGQDFSLPAALESPSSGTIAGVWEEIAKLRKAVQDLTLVAGVAGPQGPPGKAGPPGPAGPAYQLTEADMVRIVAAVRASLVDSDGIARGLPPIQVKTVNKATGKETIVPVYLGEGFQYNLFPETPK